MKNLPKPVTNLEPAVSYFGSPRQVADAIGVNTMAFWQWKKRGIPPTRAIELAALANGAFKPGDLLSTLNF